jgi:putative ABC transport system permease protein
MKLFNNTAVLGKTLQFSFMESPMKITGVLKNHPKNSSFDFGSVLSEASFQNADFYNSAVTNDWLSENFSVYALLKAKYRCENGCRANVEIGSRQLYTAGRNHFFV